jgi:hypothetical protein
VEEALEQEVDAEDEAGEDDQRDQHDDRVAQDLFTGRPGDLLELGADLSHELQGLGALRLESLRRCPTIAHGDLRTVGIGRSGLLRSSFLLSVHRHVDTLSRWDPAARPGP